MAPGIDGATVEETVFKSVYMRKIFLKSSSEEPLGQKS
jgi:hypothetical protein